MGKDFNHFGVSNDGMWYFENFAKNTSITPISIIDGGNSHLKKLNEAATIITKDDFADYVIGHPAEFNFSKFKNIFDILVEIDKNE